MNWPRNWHVRCTTTLWMNWDFSLGWILVEEMVIFTQNFIELLYIVIPLLYIRYWNPYHYGQWTTPRDAIPIRIRKRKASGKLIKTVSDWLRSLPQKGKLLALKLNQMNPYRPWVTWVYTWAWWGCPKHIYLSIRAQSKQDLWSHVGLWLGKHDSETHMYSITSMTI